MTPWRHPVPGVYRRVGRDVPPLHRGGIRRAPPYMERSSPRHEVADHVYTSTDHPPRHPIALHNEQSYNITWPLRIFFTV